MEIISGPDALEAMREIAGEVVLGSSPNVFLIIGPYGIGKKAALLEVFKEMKVQTVLHHYTIINCAEPLEKAIREYPDSVHLWNDVFYSNIMEEEVSGFFRKLAQGEYDFNGVFFLVAHENEFLNRTLPDLPGIKLEMDNQDILDANIFKI